jgi:protein O-mannosyl-transferase
LAALIAAITLAAFLPSLGNGFTTWDDNVAILNNSLVSAWSWPASFFQFERGLYHPLVTLTYALEYRLAGFAPLLYHLDNLLLHLVNTVLVFSFLLLLGGNWPAAAVAALLFGLHPTRVEPVAWVTERKEVLFVFFYLLALLSYLRAGWARSQRSAATALFMLLALLSKISAVSLPFVLLLIDRCRGEKIDRANLRAKAPLFLLALLFGVVGLFARQLTGSLTHDPPFSPANILIGAYRLLFYYLPRLVWPWRDFAFYPGATFAAKTFGSLPWLYLLSPVLLVLFGLLFYRIFRFNRRAEWGGAFFLITIAPALFLIPVGPFADRFTYLPAVGIFYLFGLAVTAGWRRWTWAGRSLLLAALSLLFVSLYGLTGRQIAVWRDGVTLWDRACHKYPRAAEAFNSRGLTYAERGELDRARQDLLRAQQLAPDNAGISLSLKNLAAVEKLIILNRKKNSDRIKP